MLTVLTNDAKQRALDKMLKEMKHEHSSAEDAIHNWLCEQEDEELFEGILKDGKSIKESMTYCASEARKQAVNNAAMIDDATVFSWVKTYFTTEDIKVEKVKMEVKTAVKAKEKPEKVKKDKEKMEGAEQLDLFDCL